MTIPKKQRLIFSIASLYPLDSSDCFQLAADADGIEIMCDPRYSTRKPEYLTALSTQYDDSATVLVGLYPNALGFPDRQPIVKNLAKTDAFCRKHMEA